MSTPFGSAKRTSVYSQRLGEDYAAQLVQKPSAKKREEYLQAVGSAYKAFARSPINTPISLAVESLNVPAVIGLVTSESKTRKILSEAMGGESQSPLQFTEITKVVSDVSPVARISTGRQSKVAVSSDLDTSSMLSDTASLRTVIISRSPITRAARASNASRSRSSISPRGSLREGRSSTIGTFEEFSHRSMLNQSLEGREVEVDENNASQQVVSISMIGAKVAPDALLRHERDTQELREKLQAKRDELQREQALARESRASIQIQVQEFRSKNDQYENLLNQLRDRVDSIITEKQKTKKDYLKACRKYYESKKVTERVRERLVTIKEKFEAKKQAAEELEQRKLALDRDLQLQILHQSASHAESRPSFAGLRSQSRRARASSLEEQEELHRVLKMNEELMQELANWETQAMKNAVTEFEKKTMLAETTSDQQGLDDSIMMRDVCMRTNKGSSLESTMVVEESLMLM